MSKREKRQPGPQPDSLRIEGDWQQAIGKSVRKKRPPEGWLERPVKKRKRRKTK